MNLAIDIGNTFIKFGVFDKGEIVKKHQIISSSANNLEAEVKNLKSDAIINSIIISSVVHISTDNSEHFKRNYSFLKLDHQTRLPFTNNYNTPETLGYDRIAAAAGGVFLYPHKNRLVIDAGTCITYELVTKEDYYEGGGISPGIEMRYKALNKFTGMLPLLEKQPSAFLTGKTTQGSIHSGVINGTKTEVAGIINQYRNKWQDLHVIITGGDAKYFDINPKSNIFAAPDLILAGLNYILDYNVKNF